MKFRDIPQFPQAHHEVSVAWKYLEETLERWAETFDGGKGGLNLDPDYQREHVWTREQQTAYVEYALMGGETGRTIIWNNPTWNQSFEAPTELVDGKQRLEAARAFLRNEIPAFGTLLKDYEDKLPAMDPRFVFQVCKLKTREEILRLYLNINAGGTPHTQEELDRVRSLLEKST